jgi:hypothetical protein
MLELMVLMIVISDDTLPAWLHERCRQELELPTVDWHFPGYGGLDTDLNKASLAHIPYQHDVKQDFSQCGSLVYALDCWLYDNRNLFELSYVDRCLINFYTASQNTGWHQDIPEDKDNDWYSLLYYVNASDGGTEFKDHPSVKHKENRFLLFKCTEWHSAIRNTTPRRLSVNWILRGKKKQ